MRVRLSTIAVTIVTVSFLQLAGAAQSAVAQNAARCEIKITTPQPGDKVAKEGWVRGTAKIPNGTFLWVVAHMKDLTAEWWPQGKRAAVIEQDSTWVIRAGYGRAEDVGEQFEVAAVVVDANTNKRLREWFKTAEERDFPSIEFPSTVEGCVPVKVIVNKTSH